MSLVRVMAIEPCNNHRPGDMFECSEREAQELEGLGLVKMNLAPRNKMRQEAENKDNPPAPAAGAVVPWSASPAAQASQPSNVPASKRGARKTPARGRRSR